MTTTKKTKTALQVIRGMRRLLKKPEAWTKRRYARDANGNDVDPESRRAKCFCLIGAQYRVLKGQPEEGMTAAVHDSMQSLMYALRLRGEHTTSPISFNDDRSTAHEDVVEALAIAEQFAVMNEGLERGEALPS